MLQLEEHLAVDADARDEVALPAAFIDDGIRGNLENLAFELWRAALFVG